MCSACIKLKKEFDDQGIEYEERDGKKLVEGMTERDEIDKKAFIQYHMQNLTFPILVED
jgi:hypothetical protein